MTQQENTAELKAIFSLFDQQQLGEIDIKQINSIIKQIDGLALSHLTKSVPSDGQGSDNSQPPQQLQQHKVADSQMPTIQNPTSQNQVTSSSQQTQEKAQSMQVQGQQSKDANIPVYSQLKSQNVARLSNAQQLQVKFQQQQAQANISTNAGITTTNQNQNLNTIQQQNQNEALNNQNQVQQQNSNDHMNNTGPSSTSQAYNKIQLEYMEEPVEQKIELKAFPNKKSVINFADFSSLFNECLANKELQEELLLNCFNSFDYDETGVINSAKIKDIFEIFKDQTSIEEIQNVLKFVGCVEDKMTFQEFKEFFQKNI